MCPYYQSILILTFRPTAHSSKCKTHRPISIKTTNHKTKAKTAVISTKKYQNSNICSVDKLYAVLCRCWSPYLMTYTLQNNLHCTSPSSERQYPRKLINVKASAKLAHPNIHIFRFHLIHLNLNSSTVPSASSHPTFGTTYLPTSKLIHLSATKPLQILQIPLVHQFYLPLNFYSYSEIVFRR